MEMWSITSGIFFVPFVDVISSFNEYIILTFVYVSN